MIIIFSVFYYISGFKVNRGVLCAAFYVDFNFIPVECSLVKLINSLF